MLDCTCYCVLMSVLCRHVCRHGAQPQLPARYPPPRVLPSRRQGPQPHSFQPLPLAPGSTRRPPLCLEGRHFHRRSSAASLRYRPLPPAWPRGRGPRHLAPPASRPAHRHPGHPRTLFGRGRDRGPRSRTSLQLIVDNAGTLTAGWSTPLTNSGPITLQSLMLGGGARVDSLVTLQVAGNTASVGTNALRVLDGSGLGDFTLT